MDRSLEVGTGGERRRIAVLARAGTGPPVVWFGGFRSAMRATKADALDGWAARAGRSFVRFDYSGHGASDGAFEDGTISRWLEEGLAVLDAFTTEPAILVGSSMGGWIALLAALRRAARRPALRPHALILIAPAVDFTEALMWDAFPAETKDALVRDGVWHRPSPYAEEPDVITHRLIEDGRSHLLLTGPIEIGCRVRVIQGMRDPDVPWAHAMRLVEHLPADAVQLTLVKDGDHRLSRPEDLNLLIDAVDAVSAPVSSG